MPRPKTVCSYPGCPELAVANGRCAAHQQPIVRTPDARPSAAQRGYGYRWQVTRRRFLRAHPNCELCGAKATAVHHIDKKRNGGSDALSNLMALCESCHNRITAAGG